ncbi:helix-turn-helix domain-containing protein [Actinomadura spongiicola]|uniref:Helix-turn-helix domain-containing protein n=1 Tax=Actinomadura spongiicola TaxID=2303421 RepID=A0A372GL53_9ACTN|nr:helix-turn-helix domain-containing protein [Actinomadura spongiicola]RFS86114.1 helix-turn-helix domain-containing protein [Actinomadura spongiicola]
MVRTPLTAEQRDRGKALGQVLRAARGLRPAAAVAAEAGISLDTLRKIERGAIAVPAFFTVAALARVLDLDLTTLARDMDEFERTIPDEAAS